MSMAQQLAQDDSWRDFFDWSIHQEPLVDYQLHKSKLSYRHFLEFDHGFTLAPFHEKIVKYLEDQAIKHLMLIMPREHGKSTLCAEDFVIHHMVFNPGAYVLIFSNTLEQAKKRARAIQKRLDRRLGWKTYRCMGQPTKDRWGVEAFELTNGSRCEVYGVGGQIAGAKEGEMRPTLIILDDIVPTGKTTMTDATVENWFFETLINLPGPHARVILVGTPYRRTDIIATLRSWKGIEFGDTVFHAFKVLHYEAFLGKDFNAIYEDDTETLWPAQWPLDRFREKFSMMRGDRLYFARQYLCRIIEDSSMLHPSKLVKPCIDENVRLIPHRPNIEEDGIEYEGIVSGVDIAHSQSESADFFVVFILGVTNTGRMHLLWIERHSGLFFKQQKALLEHLNKRFRFDLMAIEENSYQVVLAEETEDYTEIPVHRYLTKKTNKQDDLIGLQVVRTHQENRRIKYPSKLGTYTQCTFDEKINEKGNPVTIVHPTGGLPVSKTIEVFYDEMEGYIREEGEWTCIYEHNDTVLAQWFAVLAAHKSQKVMRIIGDMSEFFKPTGSAQTEEESELQFDQLSINDDFQDDLDF